ncbi:hypothetical protein BsWGS_04741 [Bradybaena similaris]
MSLEKDILIVEPFNGGSHGQLIKLLQSDGEIGRRSLLVSLPAKKWHWRARTSALYFSQTIPYSSTYRVVFTSSVLNLAELIALRPDLAHLKKIVYFHENQLVYPVRKTKERDFQYGYNQILTSLVADIVVFNSAFNMESFLSSISTHLKLIPDHRPKDLVAVIRPKCRVLYFPVTINQTGANDIHSVDRDVHSTNRDVHSADIAKRDICSVDTTNWNNHSVDTTNKDIYSVDTTHRDILSADTANRDINFIDTTNTDINSVDTTNRDVDSAETVNSDIHSVDTTNIDVHSVDVTEIHEENCKSAKQFIVTQADEMVSQVLQGSNKTRLTSSYAHESSENNNSFNNDLLLKTQDKMERDNSDTSARNYLVKVPHLQYSNRTIQPFKEKQTCLHIVWPHRWEHDKDPESFFKALLQLQTEGFDFVVSVIGETFTDVPAIFDLMRPQLAGKILAWGYQTRQDYLRILNCAHVVVSTALHEFFGVAMLEATGYGCYPLCPKRLVYPELYPAECLYATQSQLVKRLKMFCQRPTLVKTDKFKVLVEKFTWENLQSEYRKLLLE